jgi:hypothetical protein
MPSLSKCVDTGGKKPASEPDTLYPFSHNALATALIATPQIPIKWTLFSVLAIK